MMLSNDRATLRRMYVTAWRKRCAGLPLDPLEHLIADVIDIHPEYHALLADEDKALAWEESPEQGMSNPFLHLGMHLALREQISTDRPAGIRALYETCVRKSGDMMDTEHRMIACLLRTLQDAPPSGPDEQAYMECLRLLA